MDVSWITVERRLDVGSLASGGMRRASITTALTLVGVLAAVAIILTVFLLRFRRKGGK